MFCRTALDGIGGGFVQVGDLGHDDGVVAPEFGQHGGSGSARIGWPHERIGRRARYQLTLDLPVGDPGGAWLSVRHLVALFAAPAAPAEESGSLCSL